MQDHPDCETTPHVGHTGQQTSAEGHVPGVLMLVNRTATGPQHWTPTTAMATVALQKTHTLPLHPPSSALPIPCSITAAVYFFVAVQLATPATRFELLRTTHSRVWPTDQSAAGGACGLPVKPPAFHSPHQTQGTPTTCCCCAVAHLGLHWSTNITTDTRCQQPLPALCHTHHPQNDATPAGGRSTPLVIRCMQPHGTRCRRSCAQAHRRHTRTRSHTAPVLVPLVGAHRACLATPTWTPLGPPLLGSTQARPFAYTAHCSHIIPASNTPAIKPLCTTEGTLTHAHPHGTDHAAKPAAAARQCQQQRPHRHAADATTSTPTPVALLPPHMHKTRCTPNTPQGQAPSCAAGRPSVRSPLAPPHAVGTPTTARAFKLINDMRVRSNSGAEERLEGQTNCAADALAGRRLAVVAAARAQLNATA